MTVRLGDIVFDDLLFDSDADVLYMSVGPPQRGVDWDASPEGHALQYRQGELVAVTIVNVRRLLEHDGEIVVTLPDRVLRAPPEAFDEVLAAAA